MGEKKIELVGQGVAEHEWTATHRGSGELLGEGRELEVWVLVENLALDKPPRSRGHAGCRMRASSP